MTEQPQVTMEELGRAIAELEAHAADPIRRQEDNRMRLHGMTGRTKAAIYIAIALVGALIACVFMPDSEARIIVAVFSTIAVVVCGIAFLVSWTNDRAAAHIQDAKEPGKAVRRFLSAVRTRRSDSAYVALVPAARTQGAAATLSLGKVPVSDKPQQISDPGTFKEYWRNVFQGPSGQNRSVTVVRAKKIKDLPAQVAVVEVKMRFSSYTSSMALFVGPLILMLLARKHTLTVRKLLVRRGGMWYFVSGELAGGLDQLAGQ